MLLTKSLQILINYICTSVTRSLMPSNNEVHSMSRFLLIPPFKVGDVVWLDSWNIRTICPSGNLDHHFLEPFLIVEKVSSHAF